MKLSELSNMHCGLAHALEVVGDAWTVLVLKELMLSNYRFDGIQKQTKMSTNSLNDRLKRLESADLVRKVAYQEGPKRYEYRLSRQGAELSPVLVRLAQWGNKWRIEGAAPMDYRHKVCGNPIDTDQRCTQCGETVTPSNVEPVMSPEMAAQRARWAED